ncbi:MAG: hypothetical protein AAFW73_21800 [Bacteroidota bacterium]
MAVEFLTWNMQGAGSGADRTLKWTQMIGFLNNAANRSIRYVAFQEGGQHSTYTHLRTQGFASGFRTLDYKIYNRGGAEEIQWQLDYFEVSTDRGVNRYGVYFLSRYTKAAGGDWVETLRVSMGILVRLPCNVTKARFIKFSDDISDFLRPPVGIIVDDELMIASLHSTARGGFNTQELINSVCDWFNGEPDALELFIMGDFNINGLSDATFQSWMDDLMGLDGQLATVPIGGPGVQQQYTHYSTRGGRKRYDYGTYIYPEDAAQGDFSFETIYYDRQQPSAPENQPVPRPLAPGNHNYDLKSDHRVLTFDMDRD